MNKCTSVPKIQGKKILFMFRVFFHSFPYPIEGDVLLELVCNGGQIVCRKTSVHVSDDEGRFPDSPIAYDNALHVLHPHQPRGATSTQHLARSTSACLMWCLMWVVFRLCSQWYNAVIREDQHSECIFTVGFKCSRDKSIISSIQGCACRHFLRRNKATLGDRLSKFLP